MKKIRFIKIDKNFFKDVKFKIKFPMIKCKTCSQKILDTPTNRLFNSTPPR